MISARINSVSHLKYYLRCFSTQQEFETLKCKLLIIGGGTGGITMAAKFARKLKQSEIIVVEPSKVHYYQPMFTLVGGGIKDFDQTFKKTEDLLSNKAKWLPDRVTKFDPDSNIVLTENKKKIQYEYMLVAMGLQLNYNQIPGLEDALKSSLSSGVSSIYSPMWVKTMYPLFKNFKSGNAIFTFPASPVKCPGAPQKICYIFEDYLRRNNKRNNAKVSYNTSLPVIFGVKQYADALWKVVKKRDINVNLRTNLIEIRPSKKEAIFQNLDNPKEIHSIDYSLLHVTPPQGPPNVLKECNKLTNDVGFLDVDQFTLQHKKYKNIFGIGDCTNSPNSKTMAAIAGQAKVVHDHLSAVMEGKTGVTKYDGYASCPLVTGYDKCILAEFNYELEPLETLPIRQDKETRFAFILKNTILPQLYWQLMMRGLWNGPAVYRRIMHLGLKK